MNDLISRQVAIDWLKNEWDGMVLSVFDGIENLPSAQSEIVRCKDCKHWYDAPAIKEYNSCELDALIRHKDFYCANAERRTDATD